MTASRSHRISWWAVAGDEKIRRNRHMAGGDWGWDATCSCGWSTRSGGMIQQRIREAIYWHRWDVDHGYAGPPPAHSPREVRLAVAALQAELDANAPAISAVLEAFDEGPESFEASVVGRALLELAEAGEKNPANPVDSER